MDIKFSAKQLAKIIEGNIEGNEDVVVSRFGQIDQCDENCCTFLTETAKMEPLIYDTKAKIVIVSKDFTPQQPVSCTLIHVDDTKQAFIKLLQLHDDLKPQRLGISKHAIISKSAQIGQSVYVGDGAVIEDDVEIKDDVKIYPQVYLGNNVSVGENTIIYAGAKIYEGCKIGNNCIIHSGAVIGADGFGFIPNEQGGYSKIPQIGTVIIEDNVEIGANTCIDRAMLEATVIKKGVKLDNLIQVAHNCEIGEHSVLAAGCGIAGSVHIGHHCVMGGQVGVKDHVKIGNYVQVASQSGIHRNVKDRVRLIGTPAIPAGVGIRTYSSLQYIPSILERLNHLESHCVIPEEKASDEPQKTE